MVKVIGEFIDYVGRVTGYAGRQMLSSDESIPRTDYQDTDGVPFEEIPEGLWVELKKYNLEQQD